MYDTYVTIVGNALHDPEWRRTATGAPVTTFKIASTARRLDRATGAWVDGNSLRVRVVCWRNLAVNVAKSVTRGDPLIVTGRLYTRDWKDGEVVRTQYELEATAVGHDLTRGRSLFERARPRTSTSEVEDEASLRRVGGELSEPIPPEEAPAQFDDTSYEALERELAVGSPVDLPHGEPTAGETTARAVPTPETRADAGTPPEPEREAEAVPDTKSDPSPTDADAVAEEAPATRFRGRRSSVPA